MSNAAPEEYEIQAVMVNTDCGREEAIEALKRTDFRISFAIRRIVRQALGCPTCPSCGEALNAGWKYCPYCGEMGGTTCTEKM